MQLIKTIIKRAIEFVIALIGAGFAIGLYVSVGILTSNSYTLGIKGNWINVLKPAVAVTSAVLLFYVVERYMWPQLSSDPLKRKKAVKRVIIAAIIPVALISILILIIGLMALSSL